MESFMLHSSKAPVDKTGAVAALVGLVFPVAAYGGKGRTLDNFIKAGLTCLAVTILVTG